MAGEGKQAGVTRQAGQVRKRHAFKQAKSEQVKQAKEGQARQAVQRTM
jgi:hypothetical protein